MTLKTRRILFYSLIIPFILISAGVIFYSNGWRLNADDCKIERLKDCNIKFQKTGAIYIETTPKGASIIINKKNFADKSGIMQSGTLIPDFLPKKYEVKIQKDGYQAYYKNVEVKPSLVTEIIYTILIPENIEKEKININELRGGEFADFTNQKFIVKNSKDIYYLYDLSALDSSLNISAAWENAKGAVKEKTKKIKKIAFHPADKDKIIIESAGGIYALDYKKIKAENILKNFTSSATSTQIAFWAIKNPEIYYVNKTINSKLQAANYTLSLLNLITKAETKILDLPNPINSFNISNSKDKITLIDSLGELYLADIQTKELKQISSNVKLAVFAPDNKKIAFLDKNGELNIYYLEDWYKNSQKQKGDVAGFNLKNKEVIKNIYWYKDSYHLFVEYPESLSFIEIDDRLPINQYSLIENFQSAFYDFGSELLYFIQKEDLYGAKV